MNWFSKLWGFLFFKEPQQMQLTSVDYTATIDRATGEPVHHKPVDNGCSSTVTGSLSLEAEPRIMPGSLSLEAIMPKVLGVRVTRDDLRSSVNTRAAVTKAIRRALKLSVAELVLIDKDHVVIFQSMDIHDSSHAQCYMVTRKLHRYVGTNSRKPQVFTIRKVQKWPQPTTGQST
jgi:hypothetical protein